MVFYELRCLNNVKQKKKEIFQYNYYQNFNFQNSPRPQIWNAEQHGLPRAAAEPKNALARRTPERPYKTGHTYDTIEPQRTEEDRGPTESQLRERRFLKAFATDEAGQG